MSYEVLPHPADVRFRATGPTLGDAFAEVVRAFAEISESAGSEVERHAVAVESEDREALLFDFLAQLILLQEVEGCAVTRAEDVSVTETDDGHRLAATVVGGPIEEALFDIKSPTYNGMRVEREGTGENGDGEWVLEATLDI